MDWSINIGFVTLSPQTWIRKWTWNFNRENYLGTQIFKFQLQSMELGSVEKYFEVPTRNFDKFQSSYWESAALHPEFLEKTRYIALRRLFKEESRLVYVPWWSSIQESWIIPIFGIIY